MATIEKKKDAEIIMKVTTDFKQGVELFHWHAHFMARAYLYLGVTLFVEEIVGGGIFFYRSVRDFEKLHEFALQMPMSSETTPKMSALRRKNTVTVTMEFVRRPPNPPIEMLLETMGRAHRRISPQIEFKVVSPDIIQMKNLSGEYFSTAFRIVGEALEKGVTPTKPPVHH